MKYDDPARNRETFNLQIRNLILHYIDFDHPANEKSDDHASEDENEVTKGTTMEGTGLNCQLLLQLEK